jgi:hypothetical protein
MPMIVISLSRYSKYCFTSTLAYLKHGIDFSLDNRMSFCCDGEGLAILQKREPEAPSPGFRQTLATCRIINRDRRGEVLYRCFKGNESSAA